MRIHNIRTQILASLVLVIPACAWANNTGPCFHLGNAVFCHHFQSPPLAPNPIPNNSTTLQISGNLTQWQLSTGGSVFLLGTTFTPFVVAPSGGAGATPNSAQGVLALTAPPREQLNFMDLIEGSAKYYYWRRSDKYARSDFPLDAGEFARSHTELRVSLEEGEGIPAMAQPEVSGAAGPQVQATAPQAVPAKKFKVKRSDRRTTPGRVDFFQIFGGPPTQTDVFVDDEIPLMNVEGVLPEGEIVVEGLPSDTQSIQELAIQNGAIELAVVATSADAEAPVLAFISERNATGFDLRVIGLPQDASGGGASLVVPDLRLTLMREIAAMLMQTFLPGDRSRAAVREAARRVNVPNDVKRIALDLANQDEATQQKGKQAFESASPQAKVQIRDALGDAHLSAAQIAGDAAGYNNDGKDSDSLDNLFLPIRR